MKFKKKKLGKQILAGTLALVMIISSPGFAAASAYAAETSESIVQDEQEAETERYAAASVEKEQPADDIENTAELSSGDDGTDGKQAIAEDAVNRTDVPKEADEPDRGEDAVKSEENKTAETKETAKASEESEADKETDKAAESTAFAEAAQEAGQQEAPEMKADMPDVRNAEPAEEAAGSNLNFTFSSVDGQAKDKSSKADGKPKMLIFFTAVCAYCKEAVKDIADRSSDFGGVDVYAIEAGRASREEAAKARELFGGGRIEFFYDGADIWKEYQTKLGRISECPDTYFIDADDSLKEGLDGWFSEAHADKMLSALRDSCGYGYYNVTYNTDGGVLDEKKLNPGTYTAYSGKKDKTVLNPASKAGYVFDGWYKDAELTQPVKELPGGNTGGLTLYAKWKKIEENKTEGAKNIDNPSHTLMTVDNKQAGTTADGRKKLLVFIDSKAASCRLLVKSLSDNIGRFQDIDICIIDIAGRKKEEIEALKNLYPGDGKLVYCYRENKAGNYIIGQDYIYKGLKKDNLGTELIAYIDEYNLLQFVEENSKTADDVLAALAKIFGYKAPAGIVYNLNGGTNDPANTNWCTPGQEVALKEPARKDYAFEGWYLDSAFTKKFNESITAPASGSIILYAKWSYAGSEEFKIQPPKKTAYKAGAETKLELKDGKVTYKSDDGLKAIDMTEDMTSGFNPDKTGVFPVTVSYNGRSGSFDVLLIAEPKLVANTGDTLAKVPFPSNEYGTYEWKDTSKKIDKDGEQQFDAVFTPRDTNKFQKLEDLKVTVTGVAPSKDKVLMDEASAQIAFKKTENYIYNGTPHKPDVEVKFGEKLLKKGTDYTVSYDDNTDAGTATVIVKGMGGYTGQASKSFTIQPAQIMIKLYNKSIRTNKNIDDIAYYYKTIGLINGDELIKEPEIICEGVKNPAEKGEYPIKASGADAGFNYEIIYKDAMLTVADILDCMVVFDVQGMCAAPDSMQVKEGEAIGFPPQPKADGCVFAGWYKDEECTQKYDFNAGVWSDIILYARWLNAASESFALEEIDNVYYNGKGQKPELSVYDGSVLLKAGRDYTVKYFNNKYVNYKEDGVTAYKKGNGMGADFDEKLPYAEITGKGNYAANTTKVNFNILKTSIGDGTNPAEGIVFSMNNQLVTSGADQVLNPSIKCGEGSAMKYKKDFKMKIESSIINEETNKIPKGKKGTFKVIITGIENYEGSFSQLVYVASSEKYQMKNAKLKMGEKIKSISLKEVEKNNYTLPSTIKAEAEKKGIYYTLTYEEKDKKNPKKINKYYIANTNYTKSYRDCATGEVTSKIPKRTGKYELILTGRGDYSGIQSAAFTVTGTLLSASAVSVEGMDGDKRYNGEPQTYDRLVLKYKKTGVKLRENTDYTVTYSKNIAPGTAAVTFMGKGEYSGSFAKTFKIAALEFSPETIKVEDIQTGTDKITAVYNKAGAVPEVVVMTKPGRNVLRKGVDYTIRLKNNKAVANESDAKPPVMTLQGKGFYKGRFDVKFSIFKSDLDDLTVEAKPVQYNEKKPDDYAYKPAVKLMEGKKALTADKDFTIEYVKNTQADYKAYTALLEKADATEAEKAAAMPRAVIKVKEGSAYEMPGRESITVALPIYKYKLSKANLAWEIKNDEKKTATEYYGGQVTPQMAKIVYTDKDGRTAALTAKDYKLSYGKNNQAGKNKGSITINGRGLYGGSVTIKFDILAKKLKKDEKNTP